MTGEIIDAGADTGAAVRLCQQERDRTATIVDVTLGRVNNADAVAGNSKQLFAFRRRNQRIERFVPRPGRVQGKRRSCNGPSSAR